MSNPFTDPDYPVMVEWYTYKRIPRTHHVVITTRIQASLWLRQGLRVNVTMLDPDVNAEIRFKKGQRQ
jgi:hypothetical protein